MLILGAMTRHLLLSLTLAWFLLAACRAPDPAYVPPRISGDKTVSQLLTDARYAESAGDDQTALLVLDEVEKQEPENHELHQLRADIYVGQEKVVEACASMQRYLELAGPGSRHYNKFTAYMAAQDAAAYPGCVLAPPSKKTAARGR